MPKKKSIDVAKTETQITLEIKLSADQTQLSKEQLKFNKLTSRIQKLQSKIQSDTEKLDNILDHYVKIIVPELNNVALEKYNLLKSINEKLAFIKLPKKLNNQVQKLMVQLIDEVLEQKEPDEYLEKLFKKYNGKTIEEEQLEEKEEMAEMFSEFFYEATGFRVDPEDLKNGNPDMDKIKEQFDEFTSENTKSRKKTKKQIEKEALEEQKDKLKGQSLRSVYLSLAKILHPDKETDEVLKQEREEYMKLATSAYEARNLMELLKLEVKWITRHASALASTPEETLKAYIHLLNDQVLELEDESRELFHNPRYRPIMPFFHLPERGYKLRINTAARSFDQNRLILIDWQDLLKDQSMVKETLKECVEAMLIEEKQFLPFFR